MGWGGIIAQALAGGVSGVGEAMASQGLMEQKAEMEKQREMWMSQLRMKETEASQTRAHELGQKAAEAASVREVDVYGKKKATDLANMPEEQRIKTEGDVARENALAPLKREAAVELERDKQMLWRDPAYYEAAMREAASKRDPVAQAEANMRLEIAKIELEYKKQSAKLSYTDQESIKVNSKEQDRLYGELKSLHSEAAKTLDPDDKKRIDGEIRDLNAKSAKLAESTQKILDKTRTSEEVAARKAEQEVSQKPAMSEAARSALASGVNPLTKKPLSEAEWADAKARYGADVVEQLRPKSAAQAAPAAPRPNVTINIPPAAEPGRSPDEPASTNPLATGLVNVYQRERERKPASSGRFIEGR